MKSGRYNKKFQKFVRSSFIGFYISFLTFTFSFNMSTRKKQENIYSEIQIGQNKTKNVMRAS